MNFLPGLGGLDTCPVNNEDIGDPRHHSQRVTERTRVKRQNKETTKCHCRFLNP